VGQPGRTRAAQHIEAAVDSGEGQNGHEEQLAVSTAALCGRRVRDDLTAALCAGSRASLCMRLSMAMQGEAQGRSGLRRLGA
jgi:hypothetical protein